jgi:phosphopantetheinyl transferase
MPVEVQTLRLKTNQKIIWSFSETQEFSIPFDEFENRNQIQSLSKELRRLKVPRRFSKNPPRKCTEAYLKQWYTSRKSLKHLALKARNKKIISYSLSHTHESSVACLLLAPTKNKKKVVPFSNIGIDIESLERPISARVVKRVSGPTEALSNRLTNHEVWTLKEAAFKCHPKNNSSHMSQYEIAKIHGRNILIQFQRKNILGIVFKKKSFQIAIGLW